MKILKRIAIIVLVVLLLIASAAIILYAKNGDIPLIGSAVETKVDGGLLMEEVINIGELSTLEYHYSDVIDITERKTINIFGVNIDPRKQILIVKYDGVIKLGINCEDIKFSEPVPIADGKKQITVTLPPIKILSSETPLDSFKVRVDQGIWTSKGVDFTKFFDEARKRQKAYDATVLKGTLSAAALENTKTQLETLFNTFSEIHNTYEFVWAQAAQA